MLRVLIVDDERLARAALKRLLITHSDIEIIGEAENINESILVIKDKDPHLVFMDIELRNSNGFEIFDELKKPPIVIFVTAYAEHAVRAFSVNATDYLIKPVSSSRLIEALDRVRQKLSIKSIDPLLETNKIELKTPGRSIIISIDEIAALRADGDFTHVIIKNQPEIMLCRSLAQLEQSLLYPNFLRVGRSIIINIGCIRGVVTDKKSGSKVELEGVLEPLRLGPTATTRLRKALMNTLD